MEVSMNEIRTITKRIRHQEWAEQVRDQMNSGLTIKNWCNENGINCEAFKYRLRVVRNESLEATSSFEEVKCPAQVPVTECAVSPREGSISIEINGAVIRFDSGTPESLIQLAVRAVRNA